MGKLNKFFGWKYNSEYKRAFNEGGEIKQWFRLEEVNIGGGDTHGFPALFRATLDSAGFDLLAIDMYVNWKEGLVVYRTGVKLDMTKFLNEPTKDENTITFNSNRLNIVGKVYPRSSVYRKYDLYCGMPNSVGVIDPGYTGEVLVIFRLRKTIGSFIRYLLGKLRIYGIGEYIAQIVFQPFYIPTFSVTDINPVTDRGEGGFGSTGSSIYSRIISNDDFDGDIDELEGKTNKK